MAKVHHRKARKDYPDNGVKKGDMYYYVSIKTGPRSSRVMRQLTPFKRSQLTSSAFYGAMYDIEDSLPNIKDAEMVREIIGELEQLRDETQDSFDKTHRVKRDGREDYPFFSDVSGILSIMQSVYQQGARDRGQKIRALIHD